MSLNQDLFDRGVDHAAMLRMYEAGLQKEVDRIHRNHLVRLRRALRDGNLEGVQRIRSRVQREITTTLGEYQRVIVGELKDFVSGEAQFAAESLSRSVGQHYSVKTPNRTDLRNSVSRTKVLGGRTLSQNFAKIGTGELSRITNTIQEGFRDGLSINQITDNVINGGATKLTRSQTRTLVRTSVTRLSTKAAFMTYDQNKDVLEGYQYVATLDTRTTQICARNDGRVFALDADYRPMPPLHWNCRSTTIPVTKSIEEWTGGRVKNLDKATPQFRASAQGQVPISTNYDTWLRAQPYDVQLRHFQFDEDRWQTWVTGNLNLTQFSNPDGSWISLSTLRQLDVQSSARYTPAQELISRICYSPCINPLDKRGLAQINQSLKGQRLNDAIDDIDRQNDLLRWIQAQTYQQLDLANVRAGGRSATGVGNRLRKRNQQITSQTPLSHEDNFIYNPVTGVDDHKWAAHQDLDILDLEIQQIKRNKRLPNQSFSKRAGETTDQAFDRYFRNAPDNTLTPDQQDFLLNKLIPQLNGRSKTPEGATILITPNQQSVLLRSLTDEFRKENSGDYANDLGSRLASRWSKDKSSGFEILHRIEDNRRKAIGDLKRLDYRSAKNPYDRGARDLRALYDDAPNISLAHSQFSLELPNLNPRALGRPKGLNNAVGSLDPSEEIREAFQWAATSGISDYDRIAERIGRNLWKRKNPELDQLIYRDTARTVSRQTKLHRKTGRIWLDHVDGQLRESGISRTTTQNQVRQRVFLDADNALDGVGGKTYLRQHQYIFDEGPLREQAVRTADLQLVRGLGYLDEADVPQIRKDGNYRDGVNVGSVRSRGVQGDLNDAQLEDVRRIVEDTGNSLDPVFTNSQLRTLRNPESVEGNLVRERGDFAQVQTLDLYNESKIYVGSGKQVRHRVIVHEAGRTQTTGNLTPTSGEVWRPYLDRPTKTTLGQEGYDELLAWTGSFINKRANTYDGWRDAARGELIAIQDIGDLQTLIGAGASDARKALARLQVRYPQLKGSIGDRLRADAAQILENHPLLAGLKPKKRAEFKRSALEISRIGGATNLQYDVPLPNGKTHLQFRKFESSINIEWDAVSQGPQLISMILKDRKMMGQVSVLSNSKQRVYDTYGQSLVGLVNESFGTKLDWEDISDTMKDNIMTAFYGSGQGSRLDRIVDSLGDVISEADGNILVTSRANITTVRGDITRAQNRLRRELTEEGISDADFRRISDEIQALEEFKADVTYSINHGTQLNSSLLSDRYLTDPNAIELVNRLTNSNAGVFGVRETRRIAEIFTQALFGDVTDLVRDLNLPASLIPEGLPDLSGGFKFFEAQQMLTRRYLRDINKGDRNVTSVPVVSARGDVTDIDVTRELEVSDTYIDIDGNIVNTPNYIIRETGIPDLDRAASKVPVLFIHGIDPGIPQAIRKEFPAGSVFDAAVGAPEWGRRIREIAKEFNISLYESDVLALQINVMRERLIDEFGENNQIVIDFDVFLEEINSIYDIEEVSQDLIDLMRDNDYAWSF